MKSASFNDQCRLCHASIPDSGGCISDFLCEDCCRLAHPYHAYLFKKRSTTMKSYVHNFFEGIVGKFRRNLSGELECTGLALTDTGDSRDNAGAKIAALVRECAEENRPLKVASTFMRDGQVITSAQLDAEVKAAADSAPSPVAPEAPFVTKSCVIPGCGQQFDTRVPSRMLCDSHVGDSTPAPEPEP